MNLQETIVPFRAAGKRVGKSAYHFALEGELDLFALPQLEAALEEIPATAAYVHVDAADVTFIDSTGIAALASTARRIRAEGGTMALAGASTHVVRILELTGLERYFDLVARAA